LTWPLEDKVRIGVGWLRNPEFRPEVSLHLVIIGQILKERKRMELPEGGRDPAREEGILVGISSGAALAAVATKLPELPGRAVPLRRRIIPLTALFVRE